LPFNKSEWKWETGDETREGRDETREGRDETRVGETRREWETRPEWVGNDGKWWDGRDLQHSGIIYVLEVVMVNVICFIFLVVGKDNNKN
jgi:hypothetical protein